MKKLIVTAVIAGGFLIGVAYFATADHWWWKVRSARVTYNGAQSPNARVYRSSDGRLLVNLGTNGDYAYQVYYASPGKKWIVADSPTQSLYFLPGVVLSENVPPPNVGMGGAKIETNPELVVRDRSLEFTTMKLARVRVEW